QRSNNRILMMMGGRHLNAFSPVFPVSRKFERDPSAGLPAGQAGPLPETPWWAGFGGPIHGLTGGPPVTVPPFNVPHVGGPPVGGPPVGGPPILPTDKVTLVRYPVVRFPNELTINQEVELTVKIDAELTLKAPAWAGRITLTTNGS